MNREQSGAIARVHRERAVKFDEIVSSLAMDLGYGDRAMLSQDDKDTLADEAEQAIELWEADAEMAEEPPSWSGRASLFTFPRCTRKKIRSPREFGNIHYRQHPLN
jgi:hypothetical protein